MGRPMIEMGGRGKISRTKQPDGSWVAMCRVRDMDGTTRRVKASGASGQKAENALEARIKARGNGRDDVTAKTTVRALSKVWMESIDRTQGTKDVYQRVLDSHILPGIGGLKIHEASTGRLEAFLREVAHQVIRSSKDRHGNQRSIRHGGPSAAKTCRTVLALMLAMAVRHDAAEYNAIRETTTAPIATKPARALSLEDFEKLRANVLAWQESGVMGPRKSKDLVEKIDLLVATGLRPGELLALLWRDVDLDSAPATVTVTGTVKRTSTAGLHRQAFPKTDSGERILALPGFAARALERRKAEMVGLLNPLGLVFPSRAGTVIDPGNLRRQWREARGVEFDWVKPSSFRKTVATIIERESGSAIAARQLGHSSDAVTLKHYIQKDRRAPDSSVILERFGDS